MRKDTIIGGADGPTSVFLIQKNSKLTLRQKFEKLKYKIKRAYVEKTIKANSHSLDEVMDYIESVLGFVEIKDEQEYNEMRASFIMQYEPELLGEYSKMPQLKSESIEDIKEHIKQIEVRKQKAMEIPITEFDIDFHKFQISSKDVNDNIYIVLEKRFSYIGGGVSGKKKNIRRFQRIFKEIYRYYGVTREDIEKKSKRYEELVRAMIR